MIVSCSLCPPGNIIRTKPPWDNNNISHGLCRRHELEILVSRRLATRLEKQEYKRLLSKPKRKCARCCAVAIGYLEGRPLCDNCFTDQAKAEARQYIKGIDR